MKGIISTIATITTPIWVSGTQKLVSDVTSWIIGLDIGVVVLIIMYNLFKWYGASDNEKPQYIKTAKTTLVIGLAILLMSGIVNFVVSYYQ